jgi:FtsH-binding integral membrane protein
VQRKSIFKDLLASILVVLRWLLWVAIGANIAIEIAEVYLQKDVYHLAISAIFFLLPNMQIGISRLLISMDDEEMSRRFFTCLL